MARGSLIVFEGVEGSGKTTQIQLLLDRLARGLKPAVDYREPGSTTVGDAFRDVVLHRRGDISPQSEALLFMAARAELCHVKIVPALERGETVVLDRFFLSTYAYQIAGRGLPEAEVRAVNRLATGGLVPDLTVVLDLPYDEGLRRLRLRGGADKIERAGNEFHERVAAAYVEFSSESWMKSHLECGPIARVDAHGETAEVESRVWRELTRRLPHMFRESK